MEKLYWGVVHVLMPLILLSLPATIVALVCGVLGIALNRRALVTAGACCSVPLFLYVLMGEAWWRPVVPIITAMYFGAAYAVPQHQSLAAILIVPYYVFIAMLAKALFQR